MYFSDERPRLDIILPRLNAATARQVFQNLLKPVADITSLSSVVLLSRLLERERTASSGTGDGVALPHLRPAGLKQPLTAFARLDKPVDFHAVDGMPVDLVFLLLSPADEDMTHHLRRLSRVSRLLRDPELLSDLRYADTIPEIQALFLQSSQKLRNAA